MANPSRRIPNGIGGLRGDDLAKIENAVLRGLRKANWKRLGSGETGAHPDESTALPSANAPVLLKDSPHNEWDTWGNESLPYVQSERVLTERGVGGGSDVAAPQVVIESNAQAPEAVPRSVNTRRIPTGDGSAQ